MINEPALLSVSMEPLEEGHLVTFTLKVGDVSQDTQFAFAIPVGKALTTVSISARAPRQKGLAGIVRSVRDWLDLESL